MATKKSSVRELLICRLGARHLAFPLSSTHRIIHMPALSRAPGMPSLLAGFLNWQGVAVPVLQMEQLFHFACGEPQLYTPLIILKPGPLALSVDAVEQVVSVPDTAISPIPNNEVFHGCTTGEFRRGDAVVHLLSPEKILLEKERTAIREFQAMAQERLARIEESGP